MTTSATRRIPHGLALLLAGLGLAAGCGSGDSAGTAAGSISVAIVPAIASVVQGAQTSVELTVTRVGDFVGRVDVTVTGQPSGVTTTLSNPVTTGSSTTATLTIAVGAATAASPYPLVIHATGTGVSEVTAGLALTVTAPPPAGER